MSSNSPTPAKKPIEILFSYAHEDEKLRDELEKGLSVLKRQNRIVCWHDRQISGGNPWEQAISTHLYTANIILLLVSRAFIASDYSNRVEVQQALERHAKGEVRVIPVILRSCDWHDEPFAKLQALPRDARPVTDWPNLDNALYDVAKGIKRVVEELEK
jgi:TIR domain